MNGGGGGDVAVQAMIDHLRGLKKLPEDVVKVAVEDVQRAARATAAAGTTPDGKPWVQTKDGRKPLAHAAERITAKALGRVIVVTLKGIEVIHNFGTKWNPKRQVLPDGGAGIPKNIATAIRATAGRVFSRAMGGG